MDDHRKLLVAGWKREQAGDHAGAELAYREFLAKDANQPDGWFRLGTVCLYQRKLLEAEGCFRRSLAFQHKPADAWNFLGVSLAWQGRSQDAEHAFRNAMQLCPMSADIRVNLGRALFELGRIPDAVHEFHKAQELDPNDPAAFENLASVFTAVGDLPAAETCLRTVLRLQPKQGWCLLNLSVLFEKMNRLDEAEQSYRQAIQLLPGRSEPCIGLGVFLAKQGRFQEASENLRRAVSLSPDSVEALANLGNALAELGEFEEAESVLKTAMSLDSNSPATHQNIGKLYFAKGQLGPANYHYRQVLLGEPQNADAYLGMGAIDALQGNFDAAVLNYQACLNRDPNHAQAHFNQAIIQLARGEWESGWKAYEWRWKTKDFARLKNNRFSQPLWEGTPFPKQTLMIYCEQGLGDMIQFCRYASLAKERGGTVILDCPATLIPLLKSCAGIDRWIAASDPLPPFDHHIPLMSLPRVFGTLPATVPVRIPYLSADPVRVQFWKPRLCRDNATFKIGIVWEGNRQNRSDRRRSVPLALFEPLAQVANVQLISLQKGKVAEEIAAVSDRFSVIELGSQFDNEGGAFMDTAAVMSQLDLVVSIDSAPAHLAGALGVPVWVGLMHVADWRWLLDRDDTPWYPSMRLFRQVTEGDWKSVFESMAQMLDAQLKA